jgi:hypothetical protein
MSARNPLSLLRRHSAGWLAALSLGIGAAALPIQVLAQSSSLDFPSNGVICDRAVRICYDRNGVSLPLTRRSFDRRAEQNLERQLTGRALPTLFQFSGGELCDVRRQICWEDGSQRTNVSNRLSRQLFGNIGAQGNQTGTNNGNPTIQASLCDLSQRGRRLFNGNCDLRRRNTSNGTAYSVELQDGRRFAFYNRQGELVLRDGTGIWPARFSRSGNGVLFTWSDLRLETRADVQQSYGRGYPQNYPQIYQQNYPQNYPTIQNPTGQFLQDLFNNLFR